MPLVGNRLLPEALSKIVEKSDSPRQGRDLAQHGTRGRNPRSAVIDQRPVRDATQNE